MLSEDQLAAALKAFGEAVPAGTRLHSLKVTPSVGYTDTQVEPVIVFALADSDKDVQRLSQVIARGIQAFANEPGLTAARLRERPRPDVFAQAASQMNEDFPPRVQIVTQDLTDLERLYPKVGDSSSVQEYTDQQLSQMCFDYMVQVYEKNRGSQQELINAAYKIRGFVDGAQQFQGLSEESAAAIKHQIMAFALLHEDRLDPKPATRGKYLE
ncbi:hypothetical protein [Pseudomonas fluorescens]|uniref:hypothetical protein n=1 Tax=Pseudomonas fluorescens TaxID=294 RepID=UPI0010D7B049|nr:hypothetical protein [Pseudomonas fluorescens]TCV62702.1 hypothetical protein EDB98_11210 [Pseudomonas fluorescens]